MEYEWIQENCNKAFIVSLTKQINRTQLLAKKTLGKIRDEMKTLSAKNVTHIHKC